MLEKVSHIVMLKDFYGALLTPRQQDMISLYYENDWSLSEIADNQNITRQAVYDIIKRAESSLERYELKLGLVEKFLVTHQQLEEVCSLLKSERPDEDLINQVLEILRRITDTV